MPRADDRLLSAGPGCRVPGSEVTWRFGPTGGPGGQHANRAHTRVEAELDLRSVRGIDDDIRERLVARLGPRLRVVVDRHRSQARNRERALDEMELRIREALVVQRSRRPRPRRGAVERRLEAKRQQGARKAERRRDWD